MAKTVTLVHNEHFDLLLPADAPEGGENLGSYIVLNREGEEEERGKYRFALPDNNTTVELPDDYDASDLTAVTHLVQTLTDRHSDAVTGVTGDDPVITAKIAALLGVPVVQAPVTEQNTEVEA